MTSALCYNNAGATPVRIHFMSWLSWLKCYPDYHQSMLITFKTTFKHTVITLHYALSGNKYLYCMTGAHHFFLLLFFIFYLCCCMFIFMKTILNEVIINHIVPLNEKRWALNLPVVLQFGIHSNYTHQIYSVFMGNGQAELSAMVTGSAFWLERCRLPLVAIQIQIRNRNTIEVRY